MSHDQIEKLVRMASQIGKFFKSQGSDKAPAAIADHIGKFWDPRMRSQIIAHAEQGGDGLEPFVLEAIRRLEPVTES